MRLVIPSIGYKKSFIEAVKEFQTDTDYKNPDREEGYHRLSIPELEDNFDKYVSTRLSQSQGESLPEGYVPQTTYWLIEEGEFVGAVRIRHYLNTNLEHMGGHIGYDIRPSKRKKGYGNKILELALPKAKELGIEKILLTCDATNLASRKIIEKNGGVLENQVPNPETGVDKMRFWINN